MKGKERRDFRGIPANAMLLPVEIILIILLTLIVILVFEVNRSSNKLSDLMENFGIAGSRRRFNEFRPFVGVCAGARQRPAGPADRGALSRL